MPKSKAPAQTFEEPNYLARLVEEAVTVRLRLVSGEEYTGTVEYWDVEFLRLTRQDGPNLFVFKHDIRYIAEL
ncbi:MAG: Sm ribonucleo-like protein [Bryobacteraceae bacterium]|jgi:sRNA-binding regulator protein Hfq